MAHNHPTVRTVALVVGANLSYRSPTEHNYQLVFGTVEASRKIYFGQLEQLTAYEMECANHAAPFPSVFWPEYEKVVDEDPYKDLNIQQTIVEFMRRNPIITDSYGKAAACLQGVVSNAGETIRVASHSEIIAAIGRTGIRTAGITENAISKAVKNVGFDLNVRTRTEVNRYFQNAGRRLNDNAEVSRWLKLLMSS